MKRGGERPKRVMTAAFGCLLAAARGCGQSSPGRRLTPGAPAPRYEAVAGEPISPRDEPRDEPRALPSQTEPLIEVPRFDSPLPQAGGGLSVRSAFEQNQAEVSRLSSILGEKNREVVARYGRNDVPEALRVLTPIRDRMQEARRNIEQMLCWDRPISQVRQALEQRGIQLGRMRVDFRSVDAYVAAKVVDGQIDAARAADLRFVLTKTGQGVMNPSSLGASTINQRVAQALDCFGLTGRPRSPMRLAPPPAPAPPPTATSPFRFFRTCGDHVCSGYRGPTPGIPACNGQLAGSPCSPQGARCDLANGCNGHLVCAATDPATRCAR